MLTYEIYDEQLHQFFEQAYTIRCNPNSTADELLLADSYTDDALSLTTEMELANDSEDIQHKVKVNRLRCYIERIALYTRLMKGAYGTPQFSDFSQRLESYCARYKHVYAHVNNPEVQLSQQQLTILAYQSLAACYFRKGGLGKNKELCQQAIVFLDEALSIANNNPQYNVLLKNKKQIADAIESQQHSN